MYGNIPDIFVHCTYIVQGVPYHVRLIKGLVFLTTIFFVDVHRFDLVQSYNVTVNNGGRIKIFRATKKFSKIYDYQIFSR